MKNERKKEAEIWKSSLSIQVVWKADTKNGTEGEIWGDGGQRVGWGACSSFGEGGELCQRVWVGRTSSFTVTHSNGKP